MGCFECTVIFVSDQGKHFSRMKTGHRVPGSTGGKWCYTHGRVWNKDGPKYSDRLKFPKTPFSHLWGALQCASSELNQNFKMYSWAAKCEMAWFCREPLLLSWTKVDRLNLSFYDYFTFLLRRQAARILWCRIRSGCWPETFASAVFCHSRWVMLISSPCDEAEDSHRYPCYDWTPWSLGWTLLSVFSKKRVKIWRRKKCLYKTWVLSVQFYWDWERHCP